MKVSANGLAIEIEDQGPPNGEPLLLIMGLGMQLVAWPDELVADFVGRGFRVIRLDNRDIGLSQGFDHLGLPNIVAATLRYAVRLRVTAPYGMADMAADCIGVLDALGIAQAHVCGASMGGMIAQHLAAHHPQRVKSLTLVMTTSGARRLTQPSARVRGALLSRPASNDFDDVVAHLAGVYRLIGSPAYPADGERLRQRIEASVRRAYHPAGTVRQLVAIAADGDRSEMLRKITAPTRVIHGESDPLVPVEAAHDLTRKIGGAIADLIPGMGHDLPLALLPRIAAGVADNGGRV